MSISLQVNHNHYLAEAFEWKLFGMPFCLGLGCCYWICSPENLAMVGLHYNCHSHWNVNYLDSICCSVKVGWSRFLTLPLINSLLRLCGFTLLKKEKPAWFPTEELRDDNNVQPHKVRTELIVFFETLYFHFSLKLYTFIHRFLTLREGFWDGMSMVKKEFYVSPITMMMKQMMMM